MSMLSAEFVSLQIHFGISFMRKVDVGQVHGQGLKGFIEIQDV